MIQRTDIAALIAAHPMPHATLAARAGVSVRTIQRIVHGTRSEMSGHNRYKGAAVDLDVADRICLALDEQLPE